MRSNGSHHKPSQHIQREVKGGGVSTALLTPTWWQWLSAFLKMTSRYNQAGEMPNSGWCYLMFSISDAHPSVRPQAQQVCRRPALSNQGETPAWLVHTCVGKFKNGREVRTWQIYGVFVAKHRHGVFRSFACGCCGGCGGGYAGADGNQWLLHKHCNVVIGN